MSTPTQKDTGMSQDQQWGRVAEDGTVFVRTAEGEVVVGSWQAGSPDEALAFYTRRYEGAKVEANLLAQRLKAGGADPEAALATIGKLRQQIDEHHMVGDLAALATQLDGLVVLVDERKKAVAGERQEAKAKAVAAREKVVAEAEALATSTQWKASGDRFRTLLDEWKAAPRIDRTTEQALWKRFSHARSSFDRARRAHFATLDATREEAKAVKEKLVKEAESLAGSTEWGPTSGRFRSLMADWKAAGRAARSDDDALWTRFKAAQDAFFTARDAVNAERESELKANLVVKEALVAEAEALLPITPDNLISAKSTLRDLSVRWEAAGHVPRADRAAIEARLKRVEDAVRQLEDDKWRRSNPEARARAQAAVDQLEASLEGLATELANAEAAGNAKKAQEAKEAIASRQEWLVQARNALEEFSG